ncbi:coenzyme F420-0:L-glutamate ligase [Brachybacterium sp. ACRRE]|uniref:coenzyme F420-0:L-glutamate ligase n=1 Tax=Brachybacterium sp. ACRRE TaxID=2918184 RepID=UPI001EF2F110|nr:coenzyme F420-0:L-glutamate ligase [Brachybacterium sp. ACRRE]MCG7309940.1 coenzyme F420-0:L-glutamate ligase [Brachybacterium sp. ACRRE]
MTTTPPAEPVGPAQPSASSGLRVLPVVGLGEVRAGDDVAALLLGALEASGVALSDDDVLCVSTKIISKTRGLVIPAEGKQEAITEQTVRLVARRRHVRTTTSIVEVPAGPVMAAAGIDGSNSPGGLLLLPGDPDTEAEELRAALVRATGRRLGVVLSDTSSRIWRVGVGDIALGAAGLRALEDLRGSTDADGRPLHVTVRALADEISAAADLVKGKASGVPAVVVRGLGGVVVDPADAVPARALSRTGEDDWFRRPSLESVWQALGIAAEDEPVAAMDPESDALRLHRAIEIARTPARTAPAPSPSTPTAPFPAPILEDEGPGPMGRLALVVRPHDDRGASWAAAGEFAERLRTAIGAESIARDLPVDVRIEGPRARMEP